ncbi:hypothetical protein, conserved [Plasmodium gonderi]|uniref:Uncharacterized protein n=1 Tax=Plasmodium gonderi TaxID=77519 RepID=A0A1Y1JKM8_PLAGO|nr:hypothetical protein, conserved [Plasmodium gonderi]GAW80584.1 hypothetical protein, conserved [Plasmodium gonderi]
MEHVNKVNGDDDLADHCNERFKKKKKKKKKKIKKNVYLFFQFLFICIILRIGDPKILAFAENVNKNDIKNFKTPIDNENINKNNEGKKSGGDESNKITNKKYTNPNEDIRRDILLDSFNIKKFDENKYKLNFIDETLGNHADIIKNSTFIFDALNYLFKSFKENHANVGEPEKHTLRPGKDSVDANEIKRLIIMKLLKCVAVLILLYIIIRLTFSFIKKLINLLIILIFKIIKLCCCGGR